MNELSQIIEDFVEDRSDTLCLIRTIGPWRGFVHISRLRQFHLDGMDATRGLAVVPGRPSTLESTIQDGGKTQRRTTPGVHGPFHRERTAGGVIRANIEIRQVTVEKIRITDLIE